MAVMTRTALALLVPLALLSGCKEEPPAKKKESIASRLAGSPPTIDDTGRALKRPRQEMIPVPARPSGLEAQAEVELRGQVTAKGLGAGQVLIYLSKKPCDVKAQTAEHFGSTALPYADSQSFFIEVRVPRGAEGHVCAAALDAKRQVVAAGQYKKNPLKVEGEGEVIFDKLELELERLKAPLPLPRGL